MAYLAVTCHMTLVHELGAVAAVVVGNARKALTIVLSFILFPKPFSIFYIIGVLLVFGSAILHVVMKEEKHKAAPQLHKHMLPPAADESSRDEIAVALLSNRATASKKLDEQQYP